METQFDITRLGQEKLFLVLSSAERLRQNNIRVIRTLINRGYRVVVITTNQPSTILKKHYAAEGIDMGKITFIDAITKYALGRIPEGETGTKFVNSPSNLTDLGIAITEVLNPASGERSCLLFDSVSTMLIYLPSIHISKFIHFVTSKLRLLDVPGIFLAVEKGIDPLLLTQLTTYVDDVIDMDRSPGHMESDGKSPSTSLFQDIRHLPFS